MLICESKDLWTPTFETISLLWCNLSGTGKLKGLDSKAKLRQPALCDLILPRDILPGHLSHVLLISLFYTLGDFLDSLASDSSWLEVFSSHRIVRDLPTVSPWLESELCLILDLRPLSSPGGFRLLSLSLVWMTICFSWFCHCAGCAKLLTT